MPVNGCVRVLDPSRGDVDIYSKQPDELTQAISLSNPSLIIPNPETPASPVFLDEKAPVNWCAYFTKAELAHQLKEYEKTVNLLNEATAISYKPEDLNEWLIYINSLARVGEVNSAREKSLELLKRGLPHEKRRLRRVNQLEAQEIESAVGIQESFGCNQ